MEKINKTAPATAPNQENAAHSCQTIKPKIMSKLKSISMSMPKILQILNPFNFCPLPLLSMNWNNFFYYNPYLKYVNLLVKIKNSMALSSSLVQDVGFSSR